MREAYPELLETIGRVTGVIRHEEERFAHTIDIGLSKLEEELAALLREKKSQDRSELSGREGFSPLRHFRSAARLHHRRAARSRHRIRSRGVRPRHGGTARAGAGLRGRARTRKSPARLTPSWRRRSARSQTFTSAQARATAASRPSSRPSGLVNELPAGAEGEIVLDRTPFYAESGGQIADTGTLWNNERSLEVAEVRGAYYPVTRTDRASRDGQRDAARGRPRGGEADAARRERNKRNHTATHLMHAALRNILGTHVKQAGSLVALGPAALRLLAFRCRWIRAELTDIEQQVNEQIRQNAESRRTSPRSTTRWPPARWPSSATAIRSRTCAW